LRESGSIEQDADVVMFIVHPDSRQEGEEGEEEKLGIEVELKIGKQRNGPTGSVQLVFLKPYVRFENPASPAQYPEPPISERIQ